MRGKGVKNAVVKLWSGGGVRVGGVRGEGLRSRVQGEGLGAPSELCVFSLPRGGRRSGGELA